MEDFITHPNPCLRTCFIIGHRFGLAFGNFDDGTDCIDNMHKCVDGQCMGVNCKGRISSIATPCPPSSRGRDMISSDENSQGTGNEWVQAKSPCFVACGGGTLSVIPECHNSKAEIVNEELCNTDEKPPPGTEVCNEQPCGYSWKVSDWGDCSVTCNGGTRSRVMQCIQMLGSESELVVEDAKCDEEKPAAVEPCNDIKCAPEWVAMPFGECSTTCGVGKQTREVKCKQADKEGQMNDVDDTECANLMKPVIHQKCNVMNPCPGDHSCGGNFTGLSGTFASPMWPKTYPQSIICVYNIKVPDAMRIRLIVQPIKLGHVTVYEGIIGSYECSNEEDYVEIIDEDGETVRICNEPSIPYISSGPHLMVKFESHAGVEALAKREKEVKGFLAHFKATKAKAPPEVESPAPEEGTPLNIPFEPGTGKEKEAIVPAEPEISKIEEKEP